MIWTQKHPRAHLDMLGFIPHFLSENDPRSAKEQFNSNYASGWEPLPGFRLDIKNGNLYYPGDPPLRLLFETKLRNETIRFYEHSWIAIIQENGSFEVARMD